MTERLMDRAEPRASLLAAVGVGQPVGDAVQVLVLPAIVAGHALHVCAINHGLIDLGAKDFGRGRSWRAHASADLAWPTMASKVVGSLMARSESTLRSTVMPALLKPAMKRL